MSAPPIYNKRYWAEKRKGLKDEIKLIKIEIKQLKEKIKESPKGTCEHLRDSLAEAKVALTRYKAEVEDIRGK